MNKIMKKASEWFDYKSGEFIVPPDEISIGWLKDELTRNSIDIKLEKPGIYLGKVYDYFFFGYYIQYIKNFEDLHIVDKPEEVISAYNRCIRALVNSTTSILFSVSQLEDVLLKFEQCREVLVRDYKFRGNHFSAAIKRVKFKVRPGDD